VVNHYRSMREHQTVDFVRHMTAKHTKFEHPMMIWDAMESLNELVDLSDPDLELPNIQHLFQSAEAMRQQGGGDGSLFFGPF
jgi:inositol oxygenase